MTITLDPLIVYGIPAALVAAMAAVAFLLIDRSTLKRELWEAERAGALSARRGPYPPNIIPSINDRVRVNLAQANRDDTATLTADDGRTFFYWQIQTDEARAWVDNNLPDIEAEPRYTLRLPRKV